MLEPIRGLSSAIPPKTSVPREEDPDYVEKVDPLSLRLFA